VKAPERMEIKINFNIDIDICPNGIALTQENGKSEADIIVIPFDFAERIGVHIQNMALNGLYPEGGDL